MNAVTFGENLRRLRIRSGMTQEDLGRVMEKSKNNISQYETGKREPDLATLLRLAELFRVTTDELLGRPAIFRNVPVYDRYTLTDRGSPAQWRPVPCRELTEDEQADAAEALQTDRRLDREHAPEAVEDCLNRIRRHKLNEKIRETRGAYERESDNARKTELLVLLQKLTNELNQAKTGRKE